MRRVLTLSGLVLGSLAVALFCWRRKRAGEPAPGVLALLDHPERIVVAQPAPGARTARHAFLDEPFATGLSPQWVAVSDPGEFFGNRRNAAPRMPPGAEDREPGIAQADGEACLRFPAGTGAVARAIVVPPRTDLEISFERRVQGTRSDLPRVLWFEVAERYEAPVARVEDLKLLLSSRLVLSRFEAGTSPPPEIGRFETVRARLRTTAYTRAAVVVALGGAGLDPERAPVEFRNLQVRELHLVDVVAPAIAKRDAGAVVQPLAIAGEQRRALLLPQGTHAELTVDLPEHASRLEVGLGVAEEGRADWGRSPLTLRLSIVDRTGARLALERTLTPGARREDALWQDAALDLSALPAGPAAVRWEVDGGDGTEDVAAFGAPLITTTARKARRSVILISLDTLRADRLLGPGERDLMPRLRAFAAAHLAFREAYAAAPFTLPSHASMLSGQPPTVHGVEHPGTAINPARSPLLAPMLARHGYRTAAFTGGGYLSYDFGFAHGFERYSIVDPLRDAGDRLRDSVPREGDRAFNDFVHSRRGLEHVQSWIESCGDQPFFLFLHSYLVHDYSAPEAIVRELEQGCTSKLGERFEPFDADVRFARGESLDQTGTWLTREDVAHMRNYYDATVRVADEQVGAFLEELSRRGRLASTIVVITADHGEEFWEHGGLYHGKTLYQEILHVPLVLAIPGGAPAMIDDPVSLVDLAPTLVALTGIEPDPRSGGRPFAALASGEPAASTVFAEVDCQNQAERYMLRTGGRKLIFNADPRKELECFRTRHPARYELFDLQRDPGERENLAEREPQLLGALRARLDEHLGALRAARDAIAGDTAQQMSAETISMLQRLGYLQAK